MKRDKGKKYRVIYVEENRYKQSLLIEKEIEKKFHRPRSTVRDIVR